MNQSNDINGILCNLFDFGNVLKVSAGNAKSVRRLRVNKGGKGRAAKALPRKCGNFFFLSNIYRVQTKFSNEVF